MKAPPPIPAGRGRMWHGFAVLAAFAAVMLVTLRGSLAILSAWVPSPVGAAALGAVTVLALACEAYGMACALLALSGPRQGK